MKAKILIVDDEFTTVSELEELLPAMGYYVVSSAYSGDEALEMAEALEPDLVLMDIVMPGKIDGIAAAQEIKERFGIPVIFLTGHAKEELLERARKAEPLGYVMKPINEGQLDAAIRIALDKNQKDHQLKNAHVQLEKMVRQRTDELTKANEALQKEIAQRERALKSLKQSEAHIKRQARDLHESNVALSVLMKKREKDRQALGKNVVANIKTMVLPLLNELRKGALTGREQECLNLIQSALDKLGASFTSELSAKYLGLSPGELRVAYLVKEGKRSKDIATLLNLSERTVEAYRKNLRKKLNIQNQEINLRTYLMGII